MIALALSDMYNLPLDFVDDIAIKVRRDLYFADRMFSLGFEVHLLARMVYSDDRYLFIYKGSKLSVLEHGIKYIDEVPGTVVKEIISESDIEYIVQTYDHYEIKYTNKLLRFSKNFEECVFNARCEPLEVCTAYTIGKKYTITFSNSLKINGKTIIEKLKPNCIDTLIAHEISTGDILIIYGRVKAGTCILVDKSLETYHKG